MSCLPPHPLPTKSTIGFRYTQTAHYSVLGHTDWHQQTSCCQLQCCLVVTRDPPSILPCPATAGRFLSSPMASCQCWSCADTPGGTSSRSCGCSQSFGVGCAPAASDILGLMPCMHCGCAETCYWDAFAAAPSAPPSSSLSASPATAAGCRSFLLLNPKLRPRALPDLVDNAASFAAAISASRSSSVGSSFSCTEQQQVACLADGGVR